LKTIQHLEHPREILVGHVLISTQTSGNEEKGTKISLSQQRMNGIRSFTLQEKDSMT